VNKGLGECSVDDKEQEKESQSVEDQIKGRKKVSELEDQVF